MAKGKKQSGNQQNSGSKAFDGAFNDAWRAMHKTTKVGDGAQPYRYLPKGGPSMEPYPGDGAIVAPIQEDPMNYASAQRHVGNTQAILDPQGLRTRQMKCDSRGKLHRK